MKVVEKLDLGAAKGRVVFSFEFFPPKTDDGVGKVLETMERMVVHQPAFCDITWRASTSDLTLDIANKMQNMVCVVTMMHLTCTNMTVDKIDEALEAVKENGIQNILALRGDPPHGQKEFFTVEGGLPCALDLVKHIRSKYGDYFGITVAGCPEGHPDTILHESGATEEAYRKDLAYLKEKVDAGGQVIITQIFFDTNVFLKFFNDCRKIGIKVPIVPGLMPISNYKGFQRWIGLCKTKVPAEINAALEPIKDNDEAVRAYGIHLCTEMCKKILAHGINYLHLYSFNSDKSVLPVLENLGLIAFNQVRRPLWWRPTTNVEPTSEPCARTSKRSSGTHQ